MPDFEMGFLECIENYDRSLALLVVVLGSFI